jgi:RNA-directed DNA polymerase
MFYETRHASRGERLRRGAVAESAAATRGRHPAGQDRGSPQGSAISPVLANIFLHYALDLWLGREFPAVPFERYADDEILHCKTKQQADIVRDAIIERLSQVGLELNLDKT